MGLVKTNEGAYIFFYYFRQMRTLRQEKEEADGKVEEAKGNSKRLMAEKNQLKSEMEQREQKSAAIIQNLK